jgi:hypothetical protein
VTSKKVCPVCKGEAVSEYRLYHDCQLKGGTPPNDVPAGPAIPKAEPPRRPTSKSVCPVCKQPGMETLVYCAGCRTMWIGAKRDPAVGPNVPASDSTKA